MVAPKTPAPPVITIFFPLSEKLFRTSSIVNILSKEFGI
jgi:hypothetical protein